MSNQITNPPNNYDFGLDFNYAVWSPNTRVSLVNVPWNNDYRDIVRFPNKSALNTYIDNLELSGTVIDKMSFVKPGQPVRLNIPINRVVRFNYLRASNPVQPIPGNDVKMDYYYFITDVRYLAPNTTEVVLQLDIWQTFGYDIRFGNCYIERGHIGVANENHFNNYGRDYLTVPEGLDVGGEYRVIARRSRDIIGLEPTLDGVLNGSRNDVLIISTVELIADYGTKLDPELKTPSGGEVNRVFSGASAYVFSSNFSASVFIDSLKDYPWISQGIVSITTIPKLSDYMPGFTYLDTGNSGVPTHITNFSPPTRLNKMLPNWRNLSEIINYIPAKYRHLKKFLTHPYMSIELTTWSATPVSLKPESWNDADAEVMERLVIAPPSQRVQVTPRKYNNSGQTPMHFGEISDATYQSVRNSLSPENKVIWDNFVYQKGDDFGEYLDIITQITNFPQGMIVNNSGIAYLAANANSIAYQGQSADWSQQRALNASQTGYDQSSSGIDTAEALNRIAVQGDISQTGNVNRTQAAQAVVGGISGVVGGAVAGGAVGGPAGAAAGAAMGALSQAGSAINTGIGIAANDEALAIRNLMAAGNIAAQTGQMGYVRDTNKSLADWSARGDYANTIAGINAKVRDAAMIQPTVSGQYGGDTANHSYGSAEISIRWKMIDPAAIRRIGDFWLRYGYAVNMFGNIPENFMVMEKFTYWKLTETYIIASNMTETHKQTIRGIFEKGVTVWSDPSYIGNIDISDNQPLQGITL